VDWCLRRVVVAAAKVLPERTRARADHLNGAKSFQTPHRPQPRRPVQPATLWRLGRRARSTGTRYGRTNPAALAAATPGT
jgi:hypothetical protein